MAAIAPRPSRPSHGPPNMALPALPVTKTRKSASGLGAPKPAPATPRNGLRAQSTAMAPPPVPTPASAVPRQTRGPQATNSAGKTLRKTVSINSFPHPPRGDHRSLSMPLSPLANDKPRSRKSKTSKDLSSLNASTPATAALLNGTGDCRSINSSLRMSDGLISVASPPQSRSSSAQDSYSTSATTYEDSGEPLAPKADSAALGSMSEKRLSKTEGKGNVLVSVRVRPDANTDQQSPEGEWMVDGRKSLIAYRGKEGGDHYYDNVFTTHDNNSRVYDHLAKRLVRRVMEGYHGTVFAYGMTGTGKTFSMQGTASSPGVIPLAITDIFSYIRETPSREFLLRVSYLEIYNEKIHDLLSMPTGSGVGGGAQQEEIKLREDSKRGVYATPLKEEIVQSPTQLLRVIARGDQARRTASTQFNARSSRSHAVVQIVVESRQRTPGAAAGSVEAKRTAILPGGVRVSTLSLIDLAGSEKAAESKERRQEGAHINKSLLTLGTVIAKLSEWKDKESKGVERDAKHLPYRDSKLTRLLQGALSGDSLVSILCTIQIGAAGSAAAVNTHTTETLNTLKFASRAKNSIVSHARKAEEALGAAGDGGAKVLLERYRMEIVELRQQLEEQAKRNRDAERERDDEMEKMREQEMTDRHEEQMLEMQLARTALKERIDHLNRLILSSKSLGVNSNGSASSLSHYARYSQLSLTGSIRSSVATSNGARSFLERAASLTSASSTIGRRSSGGQRLSGAEGGEPVDGESDSIGEFGDGTASLASRNRALQADLADKNRYIATLEKRLLQARRASSSRNSVGFSAPNKGIMVGEDHSVAAVLKEKDAEIADLRARLDDKDRMLAALRSAARSRDTADASGETTRSPQQQHGPRGETPMSPTPARPSKQRTKSVDEMNRMLEEMIQDGVETGHIVRSVRGTVRVPQSHRLDSLVEPPHETEPLRQSPIPPEMGRPVVLGEAL